MKLRITLLFLFLSASCLAADYYLPIRTLDGRIIGRQYTGVSTNYWTDPWYTDFNRLYFDGYTNESGVFLDSSPYGHTGSNMPSVLAGPVQAVAGVNQYGRNQYQATITAGAGQYLKFNSSANFTSTNSLGVNIPYTICMWFSNTIPFVSTHILARSLMGANTVMYVQIEGGASAAYLRSYLFSAAGGLAKEIASNTNIRSLSNTWSAVVFTYNGQTGTATLVQQYICTNFPRVFSGNDVPVYDGLTSHWNAATDMRLFEGVSAQGVGGGIGTFGYYIGTNFSIADASNWVSATYPPSNTVQKTWIPAGQ